MGRPCPGSAAVLGLHSVLGELTVWQKACPVGPVAPLPAQMASGVEDKGLALVKGFLEELVYGTEKSWEKEQHGWQAQHEQRPWGRGCLMVESGSL